MVTPPPGHSREAQEAEALMLARFGERADTRLEPRRVQLGYGSWVELDGVSDDPPVYVEAWAHQGPPKAAQKSKVMNDAMRLLAAAGVADAHPRLVLLFADEEAARQFRTGTWRATALAAAGIEVEVVDLPADVREGLRAAQQRQRR